MRGAIAEGEAAQAERPVAHACYVLDWALHDAGRPAEAVHSPRALAIYERLGDLDRQAAVLNNLGAYAFHEGRWSDAVVLYRRAGNASARAGDVVNAAFGDCNVGEVLVGQGRLAIAEQVLRQARQVWRGTGYDSGVASITALLGRAAVHGGRVEEGRGMLQTALGKFRHLRHAAEAEWAEALLAEALAFGGHAERALQSIEALRVRLLDPRLEPLLERMRGCALAQLGEMEAARSALERACSRARELGVLYDVAAGLDALDAFTGGDDDAAPPPPRRAPASARRGRPPGAAADGTRAHRGAGPDPGGLTRQPRIFGSRSPPGIRYFTSMPLVRMILRWRMHGLLPAPGSSGTRAGAPSPSCRRVVPFGGHREAGPGRIRIWRAVTDLHPLQAGLDPAGEQRVPVEQVRDELVPCVRPVDGVGRARELVVARAVEQLLRAHGEQDGRRLGRIGGRGGHGDRRSAGGRGGGAGRRGARRRGEVARVARPVAVGVGLRRVRHGGTVVARIADPVAVGVGESAVNWTSM